MHVETGPTSPEAHTDAERPVDNIDHGAQDHTDSRAVHAPPVVDAPSSGMLPAGDNRTMKSTSDLQHLRLRELERIAQQLMQQDAIDEALDSAKPKQALIALIAEARGDSMVATPEASEGDLAISVQHNVNTVEQTVDYSSRDHSSVVPSQVASPQGETAMRLAVEAEKTAEKALFGAAGVEEGLFGK